MTSKCLKCHNIYRILNQVLNIKLMPYIDLSRKSTLSPYIQWYEISENALQLHLGDFLRA